MDSHFNAMVMDKNLRSKAIDTFNTFLRSSQEAGQLAAERDSMKYLSEKSTIFMRLI